MTHTKISHREAARVIEKLALSNGFGGRPDVPAIVTHWLQSPEKAPVFGNKTQGNKWLESIVAVNIDRYLHRGSNPSGIPEFRNVKDLIDYSDIPFPPPLKPEFSFIDLFAGIGGFRQAFQTAGGKCVFSSEWDAYSQKTYEANFGEIPFGDITKIPAGEIPDHDVLLGGFPCQAFSQAGLKKGFLDTRGTMFFEIQKILVAKRPGVVVLENVKQLKGHDKGRTLDTILKILGGEYTGGIDTDAPLSDEARQALSTRLNYHVDFKVLRAADFGVPQNRERVFIVAIDRDLRNSLPFERMFQWPEPPRTKTRLGDILEDSSTLDERFTISDRLWEGHVRRKEEHRIKGYGFGYSLFDENSEYTSTLSARYYKDGSEILIDQSHLGKNPRRLTPRECARLQGFPKEFIIDAVSTNRIYQQFGNSVALPVVSALASNIRPIFSEESKISAYRDSIAHQPRKLLEIAA